MDEPVVLLEDFLNRSPHPNSSRIIFPHKIVPVLLLVGIVIVVFAFFGVLPLYFFRVMPSVFNPKFGLMLVLSGSGLAITCLAIGCIWGLVSEKKRGHKRNNYESLMLRFLFMLAVGAPFPILIFGKFFYHYPFVRYPAYEIELKPTPELEREIDRFMWAKIKWHTPYDYSLDRQTIRYEVLEPVDSWDVVDIKKIMFINFASKHHEFKHFYEPPEDIGQFQKLIDPSFGYLPKVIEHEGKEICAIPIRYRDGYAELKPLRFQSAVEDHPLVELIPLKIDHPDTVYYDFSPVFNVYHFSDDRVYCQEITVGKTIHSRALMDFWVKVLLIPSAYKHVHLFWRKDKHTILDFSFSNFLAALDKLS